MKIKMETKKDCSDCLLYQQYKKLPRNYWTIKEARFKGEVKIGWNA